MRRARDILFIIILLALAVQLIWHALAPLIPWACSLLVLLLIAGGLYYRKWR